MKKVGELRFVDEVPAGAVEAGDIADGAVTAAKLGEDVAAKLDGKADKPATFTEGNLAKFDNDGNPTDSGKKPSDFQPLLTFDNAPTQGSSNPVTSAGIKAAIDGIKPTRIYNSAGTDALDDKGGLHKSDIVQSSWTLKKSGTATTYTFSYAGRNAGNNPNLFWWAQDGQNYSWMTYNPTTGVIDYVAGGTLIHTNLGTTEYGLDPSTGDVLPDISGITIKMFPNWATISGDLTFTPTQVQLLSESYTHLAVESVPTRTIAASTVYAVGDLLGDDGKAYRCIQEYTSDATPVAPSLDMTRWVEIPVLSQKADKDEDATFGNLAKFDNNGNPVDSGVSLDVMTQAEYDALGEKDENTIYVIVNG